MAKEAAVTAVLNAQPPANSQIVGSDFADGDDVPGPVKIDLGGDSPADGGTSAFADESSQTAAGWQWLRHHGGQTSGSGVGVGSGVVGSADGPVATTVGGDTSGGTSTGWGSSPGDLVIAEGLAVGEPATKPFGGGGARPLSSASAGGPTSVDQGGAFAAQTVSSTTNYAGYAENVASPSSVSATWTVPSVSYSGGSEEYSANWIGFTNITTDIVQTGISEDAAASGTDYYAWYELFPANPVELPTSDSVQADDVISASITVDNSTLNNQIYTISIDDLTAGWTYTSAVAFPTSTALDTAEWIEEAPSEQTRGGYEVLPLANFGSVTFSQLGVNGSSLSPSIEYYMNDPAEGVAIPSSVTDDAFSVYFGSIPSGLSFSIPSGDSISNISVLSGGTLIVQSGGTTDATIVDGGVEVVQSGGTATATTINSGGSQTVLAGATALAATVNSGGFMVVSSEGTVAGTMLSASGAVLDLLSGAIVSGGIAFTGSGGQVEVGGSAMPSGATIAGFAQIGDTIDLEGLAFSGNTSVGFNASTDVLTVTEGGSSATIDLSSADYTGVSWVAQSDGSSGTDVRVACFRRGTLIRTAAVGEVAVEDLAIGDRVITVSGAARPIKWIGRRAYDGRFVAGNPAVLPICIAAGAIAEGVPARDLLVSPEHALLIPGSSPGTGALVPAGLLTNGATIRQVEEVERVEYFHIELDSHDIILAEGAPAESYADCDNRGMFQNTAEYAALYPDDTPLPWQFCAPRVAPGSPELTMIRAALLARAEALGYGLTDDPDLHLIVDGERVRPDAIEAGLHRFAIPAGSAAVELASRSTVPAEIEAGGRDTRRLGVPVERLILCDGDLRIEAEHSHAALCDGFFEDEGSHRWTNGMARLPESWLRSFAGAFTLEVHLAASGICYRLPPRVRSVAA